MTYNVRIFLNRGDEVAINETQVKGGLPLNLLRRKGGRVFVDHRTVLGQREAIAGIEKTLIGMKPGGHRKVRVGPHLAYGKRGIPGLIPSNAVLTVE
ncbi:MAG TPA: FKBP-type peptidyl-prolyl cis-trans isomerase, partial [Gemmataceae bacterium]|nr:FKBP-type peptidyl-prolyl cis-trans isomerase [Gemmataceae bacterium]